MKHQYTDNNIIQYLYKEFDVFEHLEFEYALSSDKELQSRYTMFNEMYRKLPKVKFSPSDESVQSILDFAFFSIAEAT